MSKSTAAQATAAAIPVETELDRLRKENSELRERERRFFVFIGAIVGSSKLLGGVFEDFTETLEEAERELKLD